MLYRTNKLIFIFAIIATSGICANATAGDIAAGKNKAMLCAGCHGADGISLSPEIPNLRGQKEGYLVKALRDFKSGARKNPMMASVIGLVKDEDIDDIAAYFSSLD